MIPATAEQTYEMAYKELLESDVSRLHHLEIFKVIEEHLSFLPKEIRQEIRDRVQKSLKL